MSPTTRDVSTDALLSIVANRQCRTLLDHLSKNGADPVDIDELVDVLAALDDDSAPAPQTDRRRARIKLQHVHLPRLAEAGAIDYDAGMGTVRYEPEDRVERLIRFVADDFE